MELLYGLPLDMILVQHPLPACVYLMRIILQRVYSGPSPKLTEVCALRKMDLRYAAIGFVQKGFQLALNLNNDIVNPLHAHCSFGGLHVDDMADERNDLRYLERYSYMHETLAPVEPFIH